jgi:hypothetical protein
MEDSQASAAAMAPSFQARRSEGFKDSPHSLCHSRESGNPEVPSEFPQHPPNFLLDMYRRMSILTLVYINKYPYERLGGAQSVSVVLG